MGNVFKSAVTDLAETLRRVFQDPATRSVAPEMPTPQTGGADPIQIAGHGFPLEIERHPQAARLSPDTRVVESPVRLEGRLCSEDAWAKWETGAQVLVMDVFQPGAQRRMEVPALPRRAVARTVAREAFRTGIRRLPPELPMARTRSLAPTFATPVARRDLALALALPIALHGLDPKQLPKALWMRYSLQLVKGTGENIRNLDVLGLYRVPAKGVGEMRHDPRAGVLWVRLGPEASGADRNLLALARRKDDRTLVSCFLEDR